MTESRARAIALEFDVSESAVELLVAFGFDENSIRHIIKTGIERGKIKTIKDYELEHLFGIYNNK